MRTNGKCNYSQSCLLALAYAVFCFPAEPNIPEELENEININYILINEAILL